jgi:DNA mismatch endonuclease, patch repair protein
MDSLSVAQRSERMSRVRAKNTGPEMRVRRLVHGMGYRYRLHARQLPGCPDLIFRRFKAVIFVHGCFWHRHDGCKFARVPKSKQEFWLRKFEENRARDQRTMSELRRLGWRIFIVWECSLGDLSRVGEQIKMFLEDGHESA